MARVCTPFTFDRTDWGFDQTSWTWDMEELCVEVAAGGGGGRKRRQPKRRQAVARVPNLPVEHLPQPLAAGYVELPQHSRSAANDDLILKAVVMALVFNE